MEEQRQRITLSEYVLRRNGVPLGAVGALRNMLERSLGAGSFAGFWRYWNPVFGYGLARYVQSPLLRVVPPAAAVLLTFFVCGALHDLVTMGVRRSPALFFTPWFFFLGLGLVLGRAVRMDLWRRPWRVRASVNLIYIGTCLALTLVVRRIFSVP
jgi:hypothetical protein